MCNSSLNLGISDITLDINTKSLYRIMKREKREEKKEENFFCVIYKNSTMVPIIFFSLLYLKLFSWSSFLRHLTLQESKKVCVHVLIT